MRIHGSVGMNNICVKKTIYFIFELFFVLICAFFVKHAGIAFMKSVPQGTYDAIILDAFQALGWSPSLPFKINH